MEQLYDIAIVGGGIAGYTCALTAKNLRLNYLWLGSGLFGEKTAAAEEVRNFPSFSGSGKAFLTALRKQAEKEDVVFTPARVDGVYRGSGYTLSAGEKTYRAKTVVLCTGVDVKGNVRGEEEFFGKGVSYCAVCDGALYRGKEIAAVLSSEEYASEAEYLCGFASHVHVFCRTQITLHAPNAVLHEGYPTAVEGEKRVEAICTKGERVPVSGVFFLRSATPPAVLVGGLKTEGARILTGRDCSTNLPGLFAAGDVTGTPYQFAKAAGEGLVAAYSAREFCRKG